MDKEQQAIERLRLAAEMSEAYILATLKQYQPPAEEARKPWQPSPAPTGELTEWERDWFCRSRRRMQRMFGRMERRIE